MEFNNIAEVSLEKLQELKASGFGGKITIGTEIYELDTLIKIKESVIKFLKGAPKRDPADPDNEKKIFTYIYTKMSYNVRYDDEACRSCDYGGINRERTEWLRDRASSMEGAMLDGLAMCSGYSETLRNLLAEVGIEAKYISGKSDKKGYGSHAWSQVKLDGVWYHCDITNDADFIMEGLVAPNFLKSSEDCTRLDIYNPKAGVVIEQTGESVDQEKQYELIEASREIILAEKEAEAKERENAQKKTKDNKSKKSNRRPKFVDTIIELFERTRKKELGGDGNE